MSVHRFFSPDYCAARAAFLAACDDAGIEVDTFENRNASASAEGPLCCDVAWVGDRSAPAVVVTVSGTHGVEGFYGSGCQTGWLREARYRTLPRDVAAMHVHAINPYGFVGHHRVTEGNIDLNRNFIDHARPPTNGAYADVHGFLVPQAWTADTATRVREAMTRYIQTNGQQAFNRAVMGGQHSHPDGLFYGGGAATWSHGVICTLARERLARARRIAVLDLHTGLGPFAEAELICRHPADSTTLARARSWYGPSVTAAQAGQSGSPPVDGNLRMAFGRLCPEAEVTAIGVEIGTVPLLDCLVTLCADNWVLANRAGSTALGRRVKSEMRRAFFPDEPQWIEPVYARTLQIIEQAVTGVRSA